MMAYDYPHPISRTYQYKKVTKPLLERKRRARINRCLDELKDLMVDALETEGENISKLEKADILELTVRHLQRLQAARGSASSQTTPDDVAAESRWQSGFGHCAAEACRFLSALPGEAAERLARHLASGLQTNRRPNSTSTPNLLSPTLSNLERTANIVAPCSTKSPANCSNRKISSQGPVYSEINVEKSCEDSEVGTSSLQMDHSVTDDKNEIRMDCINKMSPKQLIMENKNNNVQNVEDEEEIDVERVDNRDPMWRPW